VNYSRTKWLHTETRNCTGSPTPIAFSPMEAIIYCHLANAVKQRACRHCVMGRVWKDWSTSRIITPKRYDLDRTIDADFMGPRDSSTQYFGPGAHPTTSPPPVIRMHNCIFFLRSNTHIIAYLTSVIEMCFTAPQKNIKTACGWISPLSSPTFGIWTFTLFRLGTDDIQCNIL